MDRCGEGHRVPVGCWGLDTIPIFGGDDGDDETDDDDVFLENMTTNYAHA